MGKSLATIEWSDTAAERHLDIARADLVAAVDKAIKHTEQQYPLNDPRLDMVRRARQLAATTQHVDACTWRNQGSCGCPMAAVGAVTLEAGYGGDDSSTGPAGCFATEFDAAICALFGNRALNGVLLTVVD